MANSFSEWRHNGNVTIMGEVLPSQELPPKLASRAVATQTGLR
jgi:hypothetical protein